MTDSTFVAAWVGAPVRPLIGSRWLEVESVAPRAAFDLWKRLAESSADYWPVVTHSDLSGLNTTQQHGQIESILEKANWIYTQLAKANGRSQLPVDQGPGPTLVRWMRTHAKTGAWADLKANLTKPRVQLVPQGRADGLDLSEVRARGPQHKRPHCLKGKRAGDVRLVLIPAEHGWEIPALAGFGGFNACPEAAFHVARLRLWESRFGARLLGMGRDWLELDVSRPPGTARAALDLAIEHNDYCDGDGQLKEPDELASDLMSDRWWFFWWD